MRKVGKKHVELSKVLGARFKIYRKFWNWSNKAQQHKDHTGYPKTHLIAYSAAERKRNLF